MSFPNTDQQTIITSHLMYWSDLFAALPAEGQGTNDINYYLFSQDVFDPDEFWYLLDSPDFDKDLYEQVMFNEWINIFKQLNREDVILMLQNIQLNGL